MSDGPSKVAPEAEPLDDIILGEDDATQADARHAAPPRPSQLPPKVAASAPATNFRPSSPPARFPGGSQPPAPRFPSQSPPAQPDFVTSAPPLARPPQDRPSTRPPDRGSQPEPTREKRSSGRMRAAADAQAKKRPVPTLDLATEGLVRPTPSGGTPSPRLPSSPDLRGPAPMPVLSPDDTLELPAEELRKRVAALSLDTPRAGTVPVPGVDATQERGWTPYQPEVTEDEASLAKTSELPLPTLAGPITPMPIVDVSRVPMGHDDEGADEPTERWQRAPRTGEVVRSGVAAAAPVASPTAGATSAPTRPPESAPPPSEEIPVEMDIEVPEPGEDGRASTLSLSDEIKIDEGPPATSDELRYVSERPTGETGEVEVLPEDLVSVESLPPGTAPAPSTPVQNPPPIKTAGKFPAFKEEPTGAALVASAPPASGPAGRPPPAAPSKPTPAAAFPPVALPAQPAPGALPVAILHGPPPVGMVSGQPPAGAGTAQPPVTFSAPPQNLSSAPPSVTPAQPPPPPERPANVAARTQAARRQPSSPLVFAQPVGALAPPPMTDTAAMRKKTRPWWEELFNDDFIRTMAKVSDKQIAAEVTFIEESLGCEPGAMILDLACGTGRHAVELAARGYQVVGFDLSLAMLARASDEAQDRKQKINFVQGDMREMTFEETFDGVYAWNTSFGFFDETQNATVIARVHKALKKGGQLLLDVVNRDFIIRQAPSLAWFEGDGCICMDEMTIDFIASRMKVKRTLMMDDGRTKEIEYSIRIYSLHELGKMLHDNGFRVAEVSGRTGTPGVFFGAESPRTLILAEKR